VTAIDIGGGLTVDYDSDSLDPTAEKYAAALRESIPRLFEYRVLTEFGRKLTAKAGWVAARVQHVKKAGGRTIALGHAGADLFMRPVYAPTKWWHRIEVLTADGAAFKSGPRKEVDVAGPLCFSGDLLAVGRKLPVPEMGDWFIIRDAGAYTLAAYCRHTSQLVPPVYGYEQEAPARRTLLKKGETLDDLIRFWS
jgi:diaminopimelate decarboxylase